MLMIGNLLAVSPARLQSILDDPGSIRALLYPEEREDRPAGGLMEALRRLITAISGEDNSRDTTRHHLDLDQAWHGIHFLLTGEVEGGSQPLASVISGGTAIGEDLGHGPARYLRPEAVRQIGEALSRAPRARIEARYSPAVFEANGIYPAGMWRSEGRAGLEYLMRYYERVVDFYIAAAARGDAVLLWID